MTDRIALTLMLLLAAAASASAAGAPARETPEAKWQKECGDCHIAYPPRFLGAADWDRLMDRLDRHFGDNASLDPATRSEIAAYLKRHAGTGTRHSAATLRITDTPWFGREHHELSRDAWTNPAVKRASNCTACHVDASRGDWSERGVILPPGIRTEEDEDDED